MWLGSFSAGISSVNKYYEQVCIKICAFCCCTVGTNKLLSFRLVMRFYLCVIEKEVTK